MRKIPFLYKKSWIAAILILLMPGLKGLSIPLSQEISAVEKKISKISQKLIGAGSEVFFDQESVNMDTKFFDIFKDGMKVAYGCLRKVYSCRADVCGIPVGQNIEGNEFFEYFIITDTLFSVIHVEIFNYQATKGQEIMSKSWLKQFIGFESNQNLVFGKDIDGMSGATISARSITADVAIAVGEIRKNSSGVIPELRVNY